MRVLIYTNTLRDPEFTLTLKTADIFRDCSCEVLLSVPAEKLCQSHTYKTADSSDTDFDIIISLGGDGTILSISQFAALHDIPILGINLGHLGFMTEIEQDELHFLPRLASGDYTLIERIRLTASVIRQGRVIFESDALNDAVISKGEISRMIPITIDSDSNTIAKLTCDGVIIATPTGSTAYSMSAGGPIVEPTAHNFIITPICAHTYRAGSIVLSSERLVGINLGDLENRAANLSLDGGDSFRLESFDTVRIARSKYHTDLIKLKDHSFYDTLKSKLSNV